MERTRIAARDLVFEALVAGPPDGRLVLLLHGFPQSAEEWSAQVAALAAAGHRAVAVDQRGYSPGARPTDLSGYRMSELVADVLAVADALGSERFDVVGHDWGAAVAWYLAGRSPERVRTLTAVSVPHPKAMTLAMRDDPDQQRRSAYMQWFRQEGAVERLLADDGRLLREAFGALPHADRYVRRMQEPGALAAGLAWYSSTSIEDVRTMPVVTVPVLHLWSTHDAALGRAGTLATAQFVTGPYRLEVLEGVSHWVPEEAPERVSELLLEHLAAHPA